MTQLPNNNFHNESNDPEVLLRECHRLLDEIAARRLEVRLFSKTSQRKYRLRLLKNIQQYLRWLK